MDHEEFIKDVIDAENDELPTEGPVSYAVVEFLEDHGINSMGALVGELAKCKGWAPELYDRIRDAQRAGWTA